MCDDKMRQRKLQGEKNIGLGHKFLQVTYAVNLLMNAWNLETVISYTQIRIKHLQNSKVVICCVDRIFMLRLKNQ